MFTSNERGMQKQAQVDFTRSGWRQFMRLNRSLGARFLRGFVLRYELAAYLTAHEAADVELDEGCQEICYENGVYLLLRKMQGVWYITDIFAAEETVGYTFRRWAATFSFGRSTAALTAVQEFPTSSAAIKDGS